MKNTIIFPTLGEILQGQIQSDIRTCREIIIAIKNDVKENITKLYGGNYRWAWDIYSCRTKPTCGSPCTNCSIGQKKAEGKSPSSNITSNQSNDDKKPEKKETEEEKEIKRLEEQIQKIKQKKEIQDKINKINKEIIELKKLSELLEKQKD